MHKYGRTLAFGVVTAIVTLSGPSHVRVSADVATGIVISEVNPTGSGNGTYNADWFEVTNTGAAPVDVTGWKMDDNSNAFASAVPLRGVTIIPPGASAVFFEGTASGSTDAAITASFSTAWFGTTTPPPGLLIGAYGGSGVGLGSGGDAVNLFDAGGNRITGVAFGAANAALTFDNTAAVGSTTLPLPTITTFSAGGVNGGVPLDRRRGNGLPRPSCRARVAALDDLISPRTCASAATICPSRRGQLHRPTACSRRKHRPSPTIGTPTRCSSSATAAPRSSRCRRPDSSSTR